MKFLEGFAHQKHGNVRNPLFEICYSSEKKRKKNLTSLNDTFRCFE